LVIQALLHDERRSPRHESIRLLSARKHDDQGMLAASFDNEFGRPYIGFWEIARVTATTWKLRGGEFSSRLHGKPVCELWQRIGGWGTEGVWSFGGIPNDPAVEVVRVRDQSGQKQLVDTVEQGVVMFIDWRGGPGSVIEMFEAETPCSTPARCNDVV
jgi:hypothetical protein